MMKRTMTMNWDGLGDIEDDDRFFESYDRISNVVSLDLASSGSDDDEEYDDFDDSRISFTSAVSSASAFSKIRSNDFQSCEASSSASSNTEYYDIWKSEPGSIKERRQRLLHGMGLSSNKELLRLTSAEFKRPVSKKVANGCQVPQVMVPPCSSPSPSPSDESKHDPSPSPLTTPIMLVRSRSDGDIDSFSAHTKKRKEELIGTISKQCLTRTNSAIITTSGGMWRLNQNSIRVMSTDEASAKKILALSSVQSNSRFGAFFLIKNLDTGKEFIVNEFGEDGTWKRLSDIQTGKQLTREEFEKCVGYSPVVKELMRREKLSTIIDGETNESERKANANSYLSKSFRNSKRRGVALLKNIKGVANSFIAEKDRENHNLTDQQRERKNSSDWVKVRQTGKSYKELTALHLCQEIQAHQGSIGVIKFSLDAHYLASAGEDRIIHVWEVQECEVMSMRSPDEGGYCSSYFDSTCSSPEPSFVADSPSPSMPIEKKKKGGSISSNRKTSSIPDYVYEPETVFSLSEKPVCSFQGHLDDVLDLSWSKSQLLLSSSSDKTVRLWDMETKSCLKLFAHNDYVTCVQFNPVDDRYFISGSLDAKVRIWSIPDRQVVDWIDFHEMVTAASYTPDGQGALIGSHVGSCRLYSITDCKLNQTGQIEIHPKKKSNAKKITGFQFAPGHSSEVLITSADSRIRLYDGSSLIHKFRGFRNTNSQIAASFSPDGKCIISSSLDSQVYVWKREEIKNTSTGKSKGGLITTRSHEHFQCRDVSVAIPWPGCIKGEPPPITIHSKRLSKRSIPQEPLSNNSSPLPPLPKKHSTLEKTTTPTEEDLAKITRTDSGICAGESFDSASASIRYGNSPSTSEPGNSSTSSWSSSWSLFDAGISHGNQTAVHPTTWGLVIVTAGLRGEIRAYQNFGLPVKIGRQSLYF